MAPDAAVDRTGVVRQPPPERGGSKPPAVAGLKAALLALQHAIESAAPGHAARLLPFIGTANLIGVVPGLRAPTGDLSSTVAWH